jgi:hypothetical protein
VLNWSATWVYAPVQQKMSLFHEKLDIKVCNAKKKKKRRTETSGRATDSTGKNYYSVKLPTQFTMQPSTTNSHVGFR